MTTDRISAETSGIIMLTLNELFNRITSPQYNNTHEFAIKLSYIEIYNEHVRDLLAGDSENLMIVEDPIRGVFVADLLETPVYSMNEVIGMITAGNNKRTMAATSANQFSSRSHAIIQILIEKRAKEKDTIETFTLSKLSLIDLAGSERAAVTDNKGLRMLEGANINRSLLALGNCINILSDQTKKGAFVPYRDSKLTRLLKDSLGGNTKTIMISCVSPCYSCYEETVNTLKYASRAKAIKRKVLQNVKEVEMHVSQYKDIIENLKGEICNLREQLKAKTETDRHSPLKNNAKNTDKRGQLTNSVSTSALGYIDGSKLGQKNGTDVKIQETSNKIFAYIEENWEISQSLKELTVLEEQNKERLQTLQQTLETTGQEEYEFTESLNQQIATLRQTMDSNETIKKEVENSLKLNQIETRNLKDKLMEYASSVDTYEDIQLAKKFIDIERMDVQTQNVEIKKEAMNLAKEKIMKSKQISQMEEEMKLMRQQLQEKDKVIALNNDLITHLKSKKELDPKTPINNTASTQPDINTFTQELHQSMDKSHNGQTSNATLYTSKGGNDQKTTILKELLMNLEKKINKSLVEIDEKVSTPVKSFFLKLNDSDATNKESNNISNFSNANTSQSKLNITQTACDMSSLALTPLIEKLTKMNHNNDTSIGSIVDKLKAAEQPAAAANRSNEAKTISQFTSPSQVPTEPEPHVKERKEMKVNLAHYRRQLSRNQNELPQQSFERPVASSSSYTNIGPFSPVNHTSSSSQSTSQLPSAKDRQMLNNNASYNVLSSLQNIDMGRIPTDSNEGDSARMGNYPQFSQSESVQEAVKPYHKAQPKHVKRDSSCKPTTPLGYQTKATPNYTPQMLGKQPQQSHTTDNKLTFEQFSKAKEQVPVVRGLAPKPARRPSTSAGIVNENSVSIEERKGEYKPKFIKRDRTNNQSFAPGSLTPNTLHEKSIGNISNLMPANADQCQSVNVDTQGKGFCDLRSLDSLRESLKMFRAKLNALSGMNLNERNITSGVATEIRGLVDEFRIKRYVISTKDQESLKSLGDLLAYVSSNPAAVQREAYHQQSQQQQTRGRCASVNTGKKQQVLNNEKKQSVAKKPSATPLKVSENNNPISVKKTVAKNLMAKGSFSNLNTNYAQTLNKVFPSTSMLNKLNMNPLPFKNNINILNNPKQEAAGTPLDSKRAHNNNNPVRATEGMDFLTGESWHPGFRATKSTAFEEESQSVGNSAYNTKQKFAVQSVMENRTDFNLDEIEKINSQATAQIEYSKKLDFGFHEGP
jgi:kinesin family protein 18/19